MIEVREQAGWHVLYDLEADEPIMRFASLEEAHALALEITAVASANRLIRRSDGVARTAAGVRHVD